MAGREISTRALAEILGVTEGAIRKWATKRLLVKVGTQVAQADAVQAAVIQFLFDKKFSVQLVRGIMKGIRTTLINATPGTRLRLMCHRQRHSATLVVGNDEDADSALGRAIPMGREIIVFDISQQVIDVSEDFSGAFTAEDDT